MLFLILHTKWSYIAKFTVQTATCKPSPNHQYTNSLGLPEIRGNRKYPACYTTSFQLSPCDSSRENPIALSAPQNCCMPAVRLPKLIVDDDGGVAFRPEGIEVCKKASANPNFDVFVLKLPPTDEVNLDDRVELEIHTPRSPTAPAVCAATLTQTYEEDFCEKYVGDAKGGKSKKNADKKKKTTEK